MAYTPINDGDTGLSIREKLNTGLALADTALQPDDVGTAAATDADAYATAAQGTKADSAQQPAALIASGDVTNLTIEPIATNERIYTARTTGAGTLTITAAAAGVYASCLLLLTSSANGTNVMTVAGTPEWADGIAQTLAPRTDETLALYVQSIAGTIHLTLASYL